MESNVCCTLSTLLQSQLDELKPNCSANIQGASFIQKNKLEYEKDILKKHSMIHNKQMICQSVPSLCIVYLPVERSILTENFIDSAETKDNALQLTNTCIF